MKVHFILLILTSAFDPIYSLNRRKQEDENVNGERGYMWMNQLRSIIGVDELHTANVALLYESIGRNQTQDINTGDVRIQLVKPASSTSPSHIIFKPVSSLLSFVAHFRREWVERVARHVLIIQPSKTILHGIIAATVNVVRGYFSAVHIVISYPWESWYQNRRGEQNDTILQSTKPNTAVTFFKDSIVGVFSGLLMISTAFASGIYHIVTGLEGSLEGVRATANGKTWNDHQGRYEYYSLDRDAAQTKVILEAMKHSSNSDHRPRKRTGKEVRRNKSVKDSSFYKLLQVPMDASTYEIKQAYYKQAVQIHPDKNPYDDHASTKFHIMSTVYQTLVDEDSRRAYDTYGVCYRKYVNDRKQRKTLPQINPSIFLTLLFGSDSVLPYVGQLSIVSIVDQIFALGEEESQSSIHFNHLSSSWLHHQQSNVYDVQQRQRQIRIAQYLRDKWKFFFKNQWNHETGMQAFRSHSSLEAGKISQSDFGDAFLSIIGSSLIRASEQFLGYNTSFLGVRGVAHYVKNSLSSFYDQVLTTLHIGKAVHVSIQAYLDARGRRRRDEYSTTASDNVKTDDPFQEMKCNENSTENIFSVHSHDVKSMWRKLESSLPTILELGWTLNNRDIRYTLQQACNKLFYDASVSWEDRQSRAVAMQVLGEEFLKVLQRKEKAQTQYTWVKIKEKLEYALLSSISLDEEYED